MFECECGCGEEAIEGREYQANNLKNGRNLAKRLKALQVSPTEIGVRAKNLIASWARAEPGLDAYVHDNPDISKGRGTPTLIWQFGWRLRAQSLIKDSEK